MIHISSPTRLHFGLLHVPQGSSHSRRYGGCGLMLAAPRVQVSVTRSESWSCVGPESDRALEVAQRVAMATGLTEPCEVLVHECPPAHVGLGVGTALSVAVARAISSIHGLCDISIERLAHITGRGERSAIGCRGSAIGGFLVDGGRGPRGGLAPILSKLKFPNWPIVLARASVPVQWFGKSESTAFERSRHGDEIYHSTAEMCELLLLKILPAIIEQDYPEFAEPLHHYNRLAGLPFADDQGGFYSSPMIHRLVEAARSVGGIAAGQSSWGPSVYAICPDLEIAKRVMSVQRAIDPHCEIELTAVDNSGTIASQQSKYPN